MYHHKDNQWVWLSKIDGILPTIGIERDFTFSDPGFQALSHASLASSLKYTAMNHTTKNQLLFHQKGDLWVWFLLFWWFSDHHGNQAGFFIP